MVTFSLFFGRLAKVPSDGIPYPLFVFAALLPWQVFGYALTQSANSLVGSQNLIQKVYFPRLLIPMSAVFASLVDFVWAFFVFLGLMAYHHRMPTVRILYLPVFLLLALTTALAVGLWLSALNVRFRDVRHTIPFLAQFWLIATPVAYSASLVPERWRVLYGLNPMAGVVGGFRWALLGQAQNPGMLLWVSIGAVIALLIGGVIYFQRVEALFADIV
jgi:lipopolysaccharide transport system permease protein